MAQEGPTPQASPPLVDLQMARRVAEDCGWSVAELGRFYLDGVRKQIRKLHQAVAAGDRPDLLRLAHGCAGSSSLSGVPGLAERFRWIEAAEGDGALDIAPGVLAEIETLLEEVERAFTSS